MSNSGVAGHRMETAVKNRTGGLAGKGFEELGQIHDLPLAVT